MLLNVFIDMPYMFGADKFFQSFSNQPALDTITKFIHALEVFGVS